jgi:hypothetical protein
MNITIDTLPITDPYNGIFNEILCTLTTSDLDVLANKTMQLSVQSLIVTTPNN